MRGARRIGLGRCQVDPRIDSHRCGDARGWHHAARPSSTQLAGLGSLIWWLPVIWQIALEREASHDWIAIGEDGAEAALGTLMRLGRDEDVNWPIGRANVGLETELLQAGVARPQDLGISEVALPRCHPRGTENIGAASEHQGEREHRCHA